MLWRSPGSLHWGPCRKELRPPRSQPTANTHLLALWLSLCHVEPPTQLSCSGWCHMEQRYIRSTKLCVTGTWSNIHAYHCFSALSWWFVTQQSVIDIYIGAWKDDANWVRKDWVQISDSVSLVMSPSQSEPCFLVYIMMLAMATAENYCDNEKRCYMKMPNA